MHQMYKSIEFDEMNLLKLEYVVDVIFAELIRHNKLLYLTKLQCLTLCTNVSQTRISYQLRAKRAKEKGEICVENVIWRR